VELFNWRIEVTHRRDISAALKALGILLAAFVLYHMWIAPVYFPSGPFSSVSKNTSSLPPSLDLTIPGGVIPQGNFVPRNRLIEPGQAPSAALGTLRHELEIGNVRHVEAALQKMSFPPPTTLQTRHYLAALWNNLGLQLERFGGVEFSVQAFREAVKLDPRNPTALLNLTQAYWELRHPSLTTQFLERVIHDARGDPFPHLALADILLDQGRVVPATAHLKAARRSGNKDPGIADYLNRLTARADVVVSRTSPGVDRVQPPRTMNVKLAPPSSPRKDTTASLIPPPISAAPSNSGTPPQRSSTPTTNPAHFTVRFDGRPDQTTWRRIQAILDYAFDEIGRKFGHIPSQPIPVVLHTNQKFSDTAASPEEADRLFDQTSGAIHIPVQGSLDDLGLFSRVVRHEFVHALLSEYLRGKNQTLPRWLQEGIAMQLTEDPWPEIEQAKETASVQDLIPLLQEEWTTLPNESLPMAYLAAHSATETFVNTYSMYSLRQLIHLIAGGHTFDQAMRKKFSVSYETFQSRWQENYSASVHGG